MRFPDRNLHLVERLTRRGPEIRFRTLVSDYRPRRTWTAPWTVRQAADADGGGDLRVRPVTRGIGYGMTGHPEAGAREQDRGWTPRRPRVAASESVVRTALRSHREPTSERPADGQRGGSIFPMCDPLMFSTPNAGPVRDASPVECSGAFATDSWTGRGVTPGGYRARIQRR